MIFYTAKLAIYTGNKSKKTRKITDGLYNVLYSQVHSNSNTLKLYNLICSHSTTTYKHDSNQTRFINKTEFVYLED